MVDTEEVAEVREVVWEPDLETIRDSRRQALVRSVRARERHIRVWLMACVQ